MDEAIWNRNIFPLIESRIDVIDNSMRGNIIMNEEVRRDLQRVPNLIYGGYGHNFLSEASWPMKEVSVTHPSQGN